MVPVLVEFAISIWLRQNCAHVPGGVAEKAQAAK
jgi:hypothetical protein